MEKTVKLAKKQLRRWARHKQGQIIVYDLAVMALILMHSLGYFHPYFVISANIVVMSAILLAVILLELRSRQIFIISMVFWILAAFFRIVDIEVWAERSGMYMYQILLIGIFILFLEEVDWRVLSNLVRQIRLKIRNISI